MTKPPPRSRSTGPKRRPDQGVKSQGAQRSTARKPPRGASTSTARKPPRDLSPSMPRKPPKEPPPRMPLPKADPRGERLQKLLSRAGITSRRKAEELIQEGRVRVNGKVVKELGTRASLERDRISVDGAPLRLPSVLTYLLLHKPTGVVTTLSDPEGRTTVRDLLGRKAPRVYPVGRLDFNSSGLVLLTDDGDLAERLMHPRYEIEREYRVKVKGEPGTEALQRLRQGVRIDSGRPARADVHLEREKEGKSWLRMVLREGRHHEVRRMCLAVGLSVEKLRRVRYGPLDLGRLPPGGLRPLTPREIEKLYQAVGL